jgi:signal transduction histidine kinase
MKCAFPALSLGSLSIWGVLFAACGIAMGVTVTDAINVARSARAFHPVISAIHALEAGLGNLEHHAGLYVVDPTRASAGDYERVLSALAAKARRMRELPAAGLQSEHIERIEAAIAAGAGQIEAAAMQARAGDRSVASGLDVGSVGMPRFRLDDVSSQLSSMMTSIGAHEAEAEAILEHELNEVIWSFVAAGVLYLLFHAYLCHMMRVDLRSRDALQQQLTGANDALNRRVAERTSELVVVTRKALQTQEEERRSLALELHDGVGQELAALLGLLRSLVRDDSTENRLTAARTVGNCVKITQAIYDKIGELALSLRPSILDRIGLVAALNWYVRQDPNVGSQCEITLSTGTIPDNLPEVISIAAFRIVQEAISNANRHAQAKNVHVQVCCERQLLCLCIRDDGVGFDMDEVMCAADPHAGFGILGMRERARIAGGKLVVYSEPGYGTRVEAEFPLPSSESVADTDAQAMPTRAVIATDVAAILTQRGDALSLNRGTVSH